ncbi:MAG TPA: hypothetical protein VF572_05505 [Candidatus Saccharimonadales bacterium]|jgi:hypothetical protein
MTERSNASLEALIDEAIQELDAVVTPDPAVEGFLQEYGDEVFEKIGPFFELARPAATVEGLDPKVEAARDIKKVHLLETDVEVEEVAEVVPAPKRRLMVPILGAVTVLSLTAGAGGIAYGLKANKLVDETVSQLRDSTNTQIVDSSGPVLDSRLLESRDWYDTRKVNKKHLRSWNSPVQAIEPLTGDSCYTDFPRPEYDKERPEIVNGSVVIHADMDSYVAKRDEGKDLKVTVARGVRVGKIYLCGTEEVSLIVDGEVGIANIDGESSSMYIGKRGEVRRATMKGDGCDVLGSGEIGSVYPGGCDDYTNDILDKKFRGKR